MANPNMDIVPAGKYPLPKLDDLYNDTAFPMLAQYNELNKILNSPPADAWVEQSHPTLGDYKYMKIARVEWLLTRIYVRWWTEIKSVQLMANSVVVTIRLFVIDPISGNDIWNDGVGAAPLQTDKGAGATDFNAIKSGAVQIGAPAAESYAIKDAAEKFGKIFGKDLNRKDQPMYADMQEAKFKEKPTSIPDELKEVINSKNDEEELSALYRANPEYHHLKEFMQLINARKKEF